MTNIKRYHSNIQNKDYTIKELVEITGKKQRCIEGRLYSYGWTVDEVLGLVEHKKPNIGKRHHSDIQNKDYTIKELVEITGHTESCIKERLRIYNWTIDEVLGLVKHENLYINRYHSDIQNKDYTIKELSNITGKSESSIRQNIRKGWSVDEILGLVEPVKRGCNIYHSDIQNKDYTIKELSNITGKSRGCIRSKFDREWTVDEILGLKQRENRNKRYYHSDIQNKDYTIDELCQITGKGHKINYNRLNRYNWTVDEILGLKPRKAIHYYHSLIQNKDYTMDELCQITGKTKERIKYNLDHEWSVDEILGLVEPVKRGCNIYHSDIQNKDYTIKELSNITGKTESSISSNLKRGWTVDEILGLKQRKNRNKCYYHSDIQNKDYTIYDIMRITGLSFDTVRSRLKRNWPVDEVLGLIPHLSLYDNKNTDGKRNTLVIIGTIKILLKAYSDEFTDYYECIDNTTNEALIKSREELYRLYEEGKK